MGIAGTGSLAKLPLQNAKRRGAGDVFHECHLRAVPRENDRSNSGARPCEIGPHDRWPVLGTKAGRAALRRIEIIERDDVSRSHTPRERRSATGPRKTGQTLRERNEVPLSS